MVRVVRLERTVSWSQTRRDTNFAIPGYSISAMIPRRGVKIKFFLSVVIYVVKTAFVPFSAIGGNPANAGVARLCGVSPCPIPDTATALPKQARYQLRSPPEIFIFTCAAIRCALLCSPGLRFPKKFSRYSPARFFRPLSVLRLAFSATGGARLCTPKQARYQLRSPPEIFIFTCAAIRCALLCSPGLRFPKKSSRYSPARLFRPLSVRYDNFNSIIDFLPEVNG